MENPAISNQLKSAFIGGVCLLLASFLGWLIGSSDYKSLILGTLVVLGVSIWFYTGRFFWVLVIASSFFGGTFPILGGAFTMFQIMVVMGTVRFVIEDLVLKRRSKLVTTRIDLLLIAGFMGILTLHGIKDRFGMRFLGSDVWGGRNYLNVYVGLVAFFVAQSVPLKAKFWNKLPYLILAVTAFDLAVAIATTVYPSSIFKIYPFYSAVSTSSVEELITGTSTVTGRIGAFGNVGLILVLIVFASVSLRRIFHPSNFFRLVTVGLGTLAVLYSGYRSAVANLLLAMVPAGIRDLRFGILTLLPLMAALLFGLSVVNSEVVRLPRQIQRGLSFIPGHWDSEMVRDAAGSNDFRFQIWRLWARDYFPRQPLLGRGFGFKSEWTKTSIYYGNSADYKQMIEVGNIHNGLFASLDALGIVGTIFFVLWNLRLLLRTFRVTLGGNNPAGFALRFLALYLAVTIMSYWFGATTVGSYLPGQFALAAVFLRLQSGVDSEPIRAEPTTATLQGVRLEEAVAV